MVKTSAKTPRADFVIQGVTYSVAAPYAEGHSCSVNEAGVLNQSLRENTRNNLATQLQKAVDDGASPEDRQKIVDEYVSGYEFGQRRGGGGGRTMDPVQKEAMSIARGLVRAAIKKKGMNLKDVSGKRITELAAEAIKSNPSITDQAQQRVDLLKQTAGEALELEFDL